MDGWRVWRTEWTTKYGTFEHNWETEGEALADAIYQTRQLDRITVVIKKHNTDTGNWDHHQTVRGIAE